MDQGSSCASKAQWVCRRNKFPQSLTAEEYPSSKWRFTQRLLWFSRTAQKDLLIPVDEDDIDWLIGEHVPANLFQFASDNGEVFAQDLYRRLEAPPLDVSSAWGVFGDMLASVQQLNN